MAYRRGDAIPFGQTRKINGEHYELYADNLSNERVPFWKRSAKEDGFQSVRKIKSSSCDLYAVYVR